MSTEGLAVRSGEPVFNTGIDYPLTLNGVVQSCCELCPRCGTRLAAPVQRRIGGAQPSDRERQ